MFNIEQIFTLFDDRLENETNQESHIDYTNHPLFWIGGFNKVILHNEFFKKYVEKTFPLPKQNTDSDYLDEVSNRLVFTRAWNYINKIDLQNQIHVDCLKIKSDQTLSLNLDKVISHYELLEEYEKCVHLLAIKRKVEEFSI